MYFITDVRPGEKCALTGNENEPLTLLDLDGDLIAIVQPTGSWTHEKLMSLDLSFVKLTHGDIAFDAFLGKQWVGSTEC